MTDPDDESLLDELFGDSADGSADSADSADEDRTERPRPHAQPRSTRQPETVSTETSTETVNRIPRWMRSAGEPTAVGFREIGLTITGFVIFVSVDSIMMYTPFRISGPTSLLPQAITLLFLAFGLGALLVWSIRGAWRPVGVGMMLGWVFMTLISAGYFTGLNP